MVELTWLWNTSLQALQRRYNSSFDIRVQTCLTFSDRPRPYRSLNSSSVSNRVPLTSPMQKVLFHSWTPLEDTYYSRNRREPYMLLWQMNFTPAQQAIWEGSVTSRQMMIFYHMFIPAGQRSSLVWSLGQRKALWYGVLFTNMKHS